MLEIFKNYKNIRYMRHLIDIKNILEKEICYFILFIYYIYNKCNRI